MSLRFGRLWTRLILGSLTALSAAAAAAQPPTLDVTKIGPQVGQQVPDFAGADQFGRRHTLESSSGARGTMLVFFRSADW